MLLTTFRCVLNEWYLDYGTKEKWFIKHVKNCEKQHTTEQNTSCYTFSVVEKDTNIPFEGKAMFENQQLKGLELCIQNENQSNRLKDIVSGMLGKENIQVNGVSYYFFENTKYSFREEDKALLIEFHKTYKKKTHHFDNPFKYRRVYKLRGCSKYVGLFCLLLVTMGFSYNVYKDLMFFMETGYDFYIEDAIGDVIMVLPFLLWTIRNIRGLYNLEYSFIGKNMKSFSDGTNRESYVKNMELLNEELANPEYKDMNIRITKNFVCVRHFPLYMFIAIPRRNITKVSFGTATTRTRTAKITRTCLDIEAPNGVTYQYVANKKEQMDEVKAIII